MVKVSLKSVLRNFLNHYQTLESRHKLSHNSNDDSIDLYIREFQALKELTESLKTDPNCGSNEGENDVNKRKNRYKDILPCNQSFLLIFIN
jgi:tyrosine-protein phosphatase non-receptor type 12/18/22